MKIYLADLAHKAESNPFFAPQTVPLGIAYLAAALEVSVPDCSVSLFRDPDAFLRAARDEPPFLLGLTLTSWNTDLSLRAIAKVREWSPDLAIAVGGPSVDDIDSEIAALLASSAVDFAIPSEGEPGIVALVRHLEGGGELGSPIPGVAYLDASGELVRGDYERPDIDDLPSPYLSGVLDEFLDAGMIPIVQTMRGCPYRCEFCVSGTSLWSKFSGYAIERVRAEFDYLARKLPGSPLILTDENFGLLKERDVELAEYLVKLRESADFPSRIYYYTAKIVTEHCRKIAELFAPFAWIGAFPMAFQTLNQRARKAVKRTNISLEVLGQNIEWAREKEVKTASDMVYGLPHETSESFMLGIEALLEAGVQRINAYSLLLFPGIDMYAPAKRREYGIRTGYRPMPNNYGEYWGGEIVSAEVEEVVIGTRWADFGEYLRVRRYLFFVMLMLSKDYFHELMELGFTDGLPMYRLPRHLAQTSFRDHDACEELMRAFESDIAEELRETPEAAYEVALDRMRARVDIGGLKPNLVYAGRFLGTEETVHGLLVEIERFIDAHATEPLDQLSALRYVREVLSHRLSRLIEGTRIYAGDFSLPAVGTPRTADRQGA